MPRTPAVSSDVDESAPHYRGWRVVAACFLMALFCWGFGLYGHGIYLVELQRLHGWPAALIAGASTASYLFNGLLVVFSNDVFDRLGARRFVLIGAFAMAAATSLLTVVQSPWQVYAAYLIMSFGWLGLGTVAISMILSQWFDRRRGLAISLALNGASCGGIVIAPALVALVAALGFAPTMLVATAIMLMVLVPVVYTWVGPPAAGHSAPSRQTAGPSWTRGRALRSLPFWTIAAPFALALVAQIAFIVHQIAFTEPVLGRAGAAFAVFLLTVMAVVGRLCLGFFVDRLDPRLAGAVSMLSQAAALLWMAQSQDPTALLLATAIYGFSVGNVITLPALIMQREFESAFGMLMGLSTAIGTFVGAFGPGLIGLVREMTGDYTAALLLCMALKLVAAAGVVIRGRTRPERTL